MKFLLVTFFFAVASSIIPVLNMEVYIVAAQTQTTWSPLELAVLGSIGQNIGKLFWYYAAQGAFETGWMNRRMQQPKRQARVATWRAQIEGRPWFSGMITFVSAAVGFPPFFVIAMVAGSLRMNVVVFFVAGTIGRTLFFWVLLLGAGLILPSP